jgi:TPR repeat protein
MSAPHDHDGQTDGKASPAARGSRKGNRRQQRSPPVPRRQRKSSSETAPGIDPAPSSGGVEADTIFGQAHPRAGEHAMSFIASLEQPPLADPPASPHAAPEPGPQSDATATETNGIAMPEAPSEPVPTLPTETLDGLLAAAHGFTVESEPAPVPAMPSAHAQTTPLPRVRRAVPRRTIRLTAEQIRGARAEMALPAATAPAVRPDALMLVMLLLTLVLAGTAGSLYLRVGSTPARDAAVPIAAPAADAPAGAASPPDVPATQAGTPRGNPLDDYRQGLRFALGNGVPQDYQKAAELLLKAALQGVPDAQYNLGALYANGLGVAKDPLRAATWYQAAAQQRHPLAAFNLALAYVDGNGVEQSDAEAARWFRRAAEQGVSNAQFDLAALYLSGRGVPRSVTEAYAWFSVLATSGDTEARQQVDRLTAAMSRQDLNTARDRATRLAEIVNHR